MSRTLEVLLLDCATCRALAKELLKRVLRRRNFVALGKALPTALSLLQQGCLGSHEPSRQILAGITFGVSACLLGCLLALISPAPGGLIVKPHLVFALVTVGALVGIMMTTLIHRDGAIPSVRLLARYEEATEWMLVSSSRPRQAFRTYMRTVPGHLEGSRQFVQRLGNGSFPRVANAMRASWAMLPWHRSQ